MRPDQLADSIRFLLSRSPVSPGLSIQVDLIANPVAGGFTRPSYARRRAAELDALVALAQALPARLDPTAIDLHLTDRAGHAGYIARAIIAKAREAGYGPAMRILMTAGGDGTSLEVATTLMSLPVEERRHWLVLRLPLGTGNDGSEGRDLGTALGRFLHPCRAGSRPAILVTPNPGGGRQALWSFNIASIGVDAFVADMTNRLKSSFPGDSYKFMVDVAAVAYDFVWPARPMVVRASGPKGERLIEKGCLLLAVGASGRRQYGSNKKILPGEENVCFIPQLSLFRKLAVKGPISDGGHAAFPEVELFEADRLLVEYPAPLLFQADGEVTRLETADFPLEFRIIPDAYRVLEAVP
jgi:diacylglycerol kinase family enzyme